MEREIYVLTYVDRNRGLDDGLSTSVFTNKKECIDSIIETLLEYDHFSNFNNDEEDERNKAIDTLRQKIDKTNQFDEPDLYFFDISKHKI